MDWAAEQTARIERISLKRLRIESLQREIAQIQGELDAEVEESLSAFKAQHSRPSVDQAAVISGVKQRRPRQSNAGGTKEHIKEALKFGPARSRTLLPSMLKLGHSRAAVYTAVSELKSSGAITRDAEGFYRLATINSVRAANGDTPLPGPYYPITKLDNRPKTKTDAERLPNETERVLMLIRDRQEEKDVSSTALDIVSGTNGALKIDTIDRMLNDFLRRGWLEGDGRGGYKLTQLGLQESP